MAVTLRPLYFIPFLMTHKLLLILVIRVLNQLGPVSLRLKPINQLNMLLNQSKNSLKTYRENLMLSSLKMKNIQHRNIFKRTQVLVTCIMKILYLKQDHIHTRNHQ